MKSFTKKLLNWFAKIVLHLLTKLTVVAAPFCQVEFTFFQSILDIFGCSECCDGVAERCNHVIHVECPLIYLQRIWMIFDVVFGCLLQNKICASWRVLGSNDVSLSFVHLLFLAVWLSPHESQITSVFLSYSDLHKHRFDLSLDGDGSLSESKQNSSIFARRSGPAKSLSLRLVPLCGALALQILRILSG